MPRRHRKSRRSYSYPRRWRRGRPDSSPGLIEMLIEDVFELVVAAVTALFGLLRWLWHAGRRTRPPSPAAPPNLPPSQQPLARPQPFQEQPFPKMPAPPPFPPPRMPFPASAAPEALPYRPARHLLSIGERSFWIPLYQAVRGQYRIFCKVRLADVVQAPQCRRDERRWFRKIASYHVDFVLCHPRTTAPLLAIELDDRSHNSPQRRQSDQFKAAALSAAGLPIYRVPAQEAYDPIELAQTINRLIAAAHNRRH